MPFDPVKWATPFFVLTVLLEMVWGLKSGRAKFETRDSATSLFMGLGSQAAGMMTGFFAAWWFHAAYGFRFMDIGWGVGAVIACFVLDDLAYYCFHRASHRVRWFWAAHVIHHSSQHYNLTTALRQTWTGTICFSFIFSLPLMIIGFPLEMVAFVKGLNLVYQYWIHTEAIHRCPKWFEAVMNTPSHHRVHHATNPKYLDANYAGVFIIWDKMFGTFVPEDDAEPCRYGLVRQLGTFNIMKVAFHEWVGIFRDVRSAKSLGDALKYMFMPPGWSPDGSRMTSEQIKARYEERLSLRSK